MSDTVSKKDLAKVLRQLEREGTMCGLDVVPKLFARAADLLDPPPPQEPEIWMRRGSNGCLYQYSHEGSSTLPLAPPWLSPERERVSVTKKAETDALLSAVRQECFNVHDELVPCQLCRALRDFDEAHRART